MSVNHCRLRGCGKPEKPFRLTGLQGPGSFWPMKTTLYSLVLVAAVLLMASSSKADSFTWSVDGNSTETNIGSFSMNSGHNQFSINVSSGSSLATMLWLDSWLNKGFSTVLINDYQTVHGHQVLVATYEFDTDSILDFNSGRNSDSVIFSYKQWSDPSGPTPKAPEPSSVLLLMAGMAGLALLPKKTLRLS